MKKRKERNIKFFYKGKELIIPYKKEEINKDIIQRYLDKIQKVYEDVYFIYQGKILDPNCKLNEENDEIKEKIILVFNRDKKNKATNESENNFSYSKDIICPTCGESSIITLSDYKINLSLCGNGHETKNITLENFKNTQIINEDEIKCDKCKTKRIDTFRQQFYFCYDCKINLCPLCEASNHNKNHKIIEYEMKKYYCKKHGEKIISYCSECKKNLCDKCEKNHKKFIENFEEIKISNVYELRKIIDELKNEINNIIDEFNIFLNYLEKYYEINDNFENKYKNNNNKNYQILSNIKYLNHSNEKMIKNIDNIINQITKENKFSILDDIYIKMLPEITLKYKIEQIEDTNIFGRYFVSDNKNNFKMKIDEKLCELNSCLKKEQIRNKIFEVKLIQIKKTKDLSQMFYSNDPPIPLISISDDLEKMDISNITNISRMFCNCKSLIALPDISKWNFSNIINKEGIFENCSEQIIFPKLPNLKIFEGFMYETQFLKFKDIFKNYLLKKEKSENIFEIIGPLEYVNSNYLRIFSLNNNELEKQFEIPNEYKINNFVLSLNLEIKEEKEGFEEIFQTLYKEYLSSIICDKYEIKFRKKNKKLYFDFISKDKNQEFAIFQREFELLNLLINFCDFDIILKTGFESKDNEKNNFDHMYLCLLVIKSSISISYIIKSLYDSLKEVKFNSIFISEIKDSYNQYYEKKDSLDLNQFKGVIKELENGYLFYITIFLGVVFQSLVSSNLTEHVLLLNFDDIKLAYYKPKNKIGVEFNLNLITSNYFKEILNLAIKSKNENK